MKNLSVAIVENEEKDYSILKKNLSLYAQKNNINILCNRYSDGVSFLDGYKPVFDIVFLDIGLPEMDGMRVAKKLREADKLVILVFVTDYPQYAIKGYEYDARDYILKPIITESFFFKMDRIISSVMLNEKKDLSIPISNGKIRVSSDKMLYVEVSGHKLFYHLTDKVIESRGNLASLEESLKDYGYSRCSNCYLVNLKYVESVQGFNLTIGGEQLQISRPRRKEFLAELNDWLAKGGGDAVR